MDFLFVTTYELSALKDISLTQRVLYLMGIRPYMDRKTFIVGVKRKISYQSLRETLYVAPIPGVKAQYPSRQQTKRAVKSLAREGLIEIRSTTKNLIVKCLLADRREPVLNEDKSMSQKQTTTEKETRILTSNQDSKSTASVPKFVSSSGSENTEKALYEKFEFFWNNYPLPSYKASAWKKFKQLNPDNAAFELLMFSLYEQKNQSKKDGETHTWPYLSDWLDRIK